MATQAGAARAQSVGGFTLVETVIAILIASLMLLALYSSYASGCGMIKVTREDLRATQILLQRLERVRLCSFDQVSDFGINPATSTEYYNLKDQTGASGNVIFTITYASATPASGTIPDAYRANMLLVTVSASWTNGTTVCQRSMQTYVAKDGMQGYIVDGVAN